MLNRGFCGEVGGLLAGPAGWEMDDVTRREGKYRSDLGSGEWFRKED
jgi:hypothetical protein